MHLAKQDKNQTRFPKSLAVI